MNLKLELFDKYKKEPFLKIYDDKIKGLLELNDLYVLSNISGGILIIPIEKADWIVVQVFEDIEIAKRYIKDNKLESVAKIDRLSMNNFLLMSERLFYKGVTGILYNCILSDLGTIYIPMPFLFDEIEDTLICSKNQHIISILLKALYTNEFLNYLYNPTLNPNEIAIGIVRYVIRNDGRQKYIDLFETREIAEDYCKSKQLEKRLDDFYIKPMDKVGDKEVLSEIGDDYTKEKYPISTVINSVLFHSIKTILEAEMKEYNSKEMIQSCKSNMFVKIHSLKKVYKINMSDFLQLIINTGFEQLVLN